MKRLIRVNQDIPWLPKPGEGRLYITDEMPAPAKCATAFGFAFDNDRLLMTRLRDKNRNWDIPGGRIEVSETPQEAAIREVWEETKVNIEVLELIGTQELELFGECPTHHTWPYPISVQLYFLCRIVSVESFKEDNEATERGYFAPLEARQFPSMINHDVIYEEALRRLRK
jgi:8-oxo-dGTP diphosphatase